MAKSIGQVATTQTFQNWLTKTNDLVDILEANIITAEVGGTPDTTTGDANLAGTFSATNLTASTLLSADAIGPVTGGGTIAFNGQVQVNGPSQTTTIFSNAGGGQTRYTNGSLSWDVGLENGNPGNFIINTGVAPNKFSLSTAGTLTVPDAVITGSLTVGSLSIGAGGSGLTTDDVSEGARLYFTEDRARAAFSGGDGINIATDGTISFDGEGELNTYQGNEFIVTGSVGSGIKSYISGSQNVGVPYGQLSAEWASNTYNTLTWFPAGVSVVGYVYATDNIQTNGGDIVVKDGSTIKAFMDQSGNGYFTGDVTTNGSASDERLKENIVPLEKGLEQVEQIKTYTFNYKDRPEDTLPGVIAQEIEQILPEVVYDIEMEDDTYKAVRYQQIVPVLIEAIKDLSDKVKDLENRLENNG
jgi:hypothetical protein